MEIELATKKLISLDTYLLMQAAVILDSPEEAKKIVDSILELNETSVEE